MNAVPQTRREPENPHEDSETAEAFATSWNTLPVGSVYTEEQVRDWLDPVEPREVSGMDVLELGCGNGSLLYHVASWNPATIVGVDLGSSVMSARRNMQLSGLQNWKIKQADLTTFQSEGFDIVYCIGVLHHLKDPHKGFQSVIQNTKKGGRFHCWVYAREGNSIVIHFVDPLRKVVSRFPWWFTKYGVALPLSVPFYLYSKLVFALSENFLTNLLPMAKYCRWIAKRGFRFFWHVAFDQLVTPQTQYIDRGTLEKWLLETQEIAPGSTYILQRNGNSWKFGGEIAESAERETEA